MINLRGNIFGHRRETQRAGILGLLNTFASTHFERFLKPAAFLAARVLSRIWLCNVTTYKNRFLALTPTSRRSSSARSALMEVPNDEIRAALQENYDRHSPLLLPRVFFFFRVFHAFSHLFTHKESPFHYATGGSFNSDQNKVAPKTHSSLNIYYMCCREKNSSQLSSRRRPAALPEHTDWAAQSDLEFFATSECESVSAQLYITASKKKITHTHSLFRTHTASKQQRCKLSSAKSVIIILWRPWLCIGTYFCGLILYYIYSQCAERKSVGPHIHGE